jgi:hypothetical protein
VTQELLWNAHWMRLSVPAGTPWAGNTKVAKKTANAYETRFNLKVPR